MNLSSARRVWRATVAIFYLRLVTQLYAESAMDSRFDRQSAVRVRQLAGDSVGGLFAGWRGRVVHYGNGAAEDEFEHGLAVEIVKNPTDDGDYREDDQRRDEFGVMDPFLNVRTEHVG